MIYDKYDVAVIGAGHAGCEAALACARLGLKTIVFTVSIESIAMMPCNPNIGGTSKGHLVREVDALGGEMGKNIDKTFIQSKMLNTSKGPAVHSLRAQADKRNYTASMRHTMENTDNLIIRQDEVVEILVDDYEKLNTIKKAGVSDKPQRDHETYPGILENENIINNNDERVADEVSPEKRTGNRKVTGVRTKSGNIYPCDCAIICTGVYLKARCITGEISTYSGPNGLPAANGLSQSLIDLGIEIRRFKTGTPARVDKRSIDFSKMEEQFGDEKITPFSFTNKSEDIDRKQVSCWLTYTNEKTHEIIRDNIDRSPLFSGVIEGVGPRYCPSIEDKVMRFADKDRHQVFIEPEGLDTNEMYLSGMSSSLPEDVQYAMYRSVPGLENAVIVRNAYAIEYDCINATQLKHTLEFKNIDGLFSAGQSNGSSGYEEAAAQGIIAGINAAMKLKEKEPLILDRSDAYIGVLIDDLVTKETSEPYRMMTSRAEYRLLLRQDNADLRLYEQGYRVGLLPKERYEAVVQKKDQIASEIERLETTFVGTSADIQEFLENNDSTLLTTGVSLAELIRRPELDYYRIEPIDRNRPVLSEDVCEQVSIEIKYSGYISRQTAQVEQFKKLEKKLIPEDIDYALVPSLRIEARQKLMKLRPASIGQASRISGVSPADINVLVVFLKSCCKD